MGKALHELGSTFSWLDLEAFIKFAPADSALAIAADELSPFRTPTALLLRHAVDYLAGGNWQRGGGKGARPEPFYTRLERTVRAAKAEASAPKTQEEVAAIRKRIIARKQRARRS